MAKLHQIDPKSLRTWRKQKEKLVQLHCTEKGSTRKALPKTVSTHRFPVMETVLSSWIFEARSLGYAVSMKSMCQMALHFLDELNIPHENFKASLGWAKRFIDRQGLSSRRVSTLNQHNPKDITQKVLRFILYMRGVLECHIGAKVWACDETPVFYDLVNKSTYDKKGKRK